jgi:hypothetical protein
MIKDTYRTLFQKYEVTASDRKSYEAIIAAATSFDEVEQIINQFMGDYVSKMNKHLTTMIQDILNTAISTEMLNSEVRNAENVFVFSSSVYERTLKANYAIVADMVAGKCVDLIHGKPKVQKMLTDNLISQFNTRIEGAMANTRADVLNYIRKLQREMILKNRQLMQMASQGMFEGAIETEKILFEKNLLKKFPQLEKMLKEGKVLKSRSWVDDKGVERFRTYTLEEYTEMSVSETLKNVDRDAVEYSAKYMNEPVVEFYLRDHRHVEDPNEACAHIMNKKLWGMSLLATSESAARVLGIWSIDKARAEHSLEIARHCRHSIRRCSDEVLNKINKLLNISGLTDQINEV